MNNQTVEERAMVLLKNHQNQSGQWDTVINAQLSFYKKMYKYYKACASSNLFNHIPEDIETLLQDNKVLMQKCKELQGSVILLTQQKKHLSDTCKLLQESNKQLRQNQ